VQGQGLILTALVYELHDDSIEVLR